MADIDLPASGKDESWTITFDGIVKKLDDQVTRARVRQVNDEIITKPLGQSGALIDQTFSHYEIEFEIAVASKVVDELLDLIDAAKEARVPSVISATCTTRYRDLTSKTHLYYDCKVADYSRSASRGEAISVNLTMKFGRHRVAA